MRSARVVVEVNIRGATENKPTSQGRVYLLFNSGHSESLSYRSNLLKSIPLLSAISSIPTYRSLNRLLVLLKASSA